ncbi:MAG TPA: RHS repeat-associated core domain-containing protein [Chitinophagaceae bacterium]|nr:RHS repeat-associated core domain-containing protein [Chitinophagaceae bacterium]
MLPFRGWGLNWIIVDEEFKKVNSSFHLGAIQVPLISGSMEKQTLTGPANMTVRRNGWLYVYLSNESNQDVYFDDLIVDHQRGPVVEQNNYYPFGLEIPGLASKAIGFGGDHDNRIKYNGKEAQSKEFSDGSGIDWDDYGARMYDPKIGRFNTVDPHADLYASLTPYNYVLNNPINLMDPSGMDAEFHGEGAQAFIKEYQRSNQEDGENDKGKGKKQKEKNGDGDQKGMITNAPGWMKRGYPVRAWLQNKSHDILQFMGINTFDDWLHDRFNGNNSAGEVTSSTAELAHVIFSPTGIEGEGGGEINDPTPTISEQALDISKQENKNSISIESGDNMTYHYDLKGAPHKGVSTPHVQRSFKNTNSSTGESFFNKDSKWVRPMTQADIDFIRNYLDNSNK